MFLLISVNIGILSYLWPSRERKGEVVILRMRRPCLWLATNKSAGCLRTHLQALWTHFSAFMPKYQCMLKISWKNTAYKSWFEISWAKGLEVGWWICEWIGAGEELKGCTHSLGGADRVAANAHPAVPLILLIQANVSWCNSSKSCLDILTVLTYQPYNSSTTTSGPYFSSNPHIDAELFLNSQHCICS